MKLRGNKGEWSELYAFVKLLSTGRLYGADEKVNRIPDLYFPILKIIRAEEPGLEMEYIIRAENGTVEIHWHTDTIKELMQSDLARTAGYLFTNIVNGGSRAFEIEGSDAILRELVCTKIAAPSTDKTDISMQIHDVYTGYDSICGFSIKSELGSPPTLLNASGATNFIFEVTGLTDAQAERINSIQTATKIMDRISTIASLGTMKYKGLKSDNFAGNLMLIDTYMDAILAEMLMAYYRNSAKDCKTLVAQLEASNPLGYPRKGIYQFKFKKFLCAIALGMMPSKAWDGCDEANGGYVIVKDDGDVVAYHLYNRDAFETYLLNNTKFERGSTTKHGFASLYTGEDGKRYINLNLQIRFI